MAITSGILALIGLVLVICAAVKQARFDPDNPKYNIGTGVAVTPPSPPLGGSPLGAPPGAQVFHVSVPGARQLVVDQGRLTYLVVVGSGFQAVAVVVALVSR